jgi:hypothetical protein
MRLCEKFSQIPKSLGRESCDSNCGVAPDSNIDGTHSALYFETSPLICPRTMSTRE